MYPASRYWTAYNAQSGGSGVPGQVQNVQLLLSGQPSATPGGAGGSFQGSPQGFYIPTASAFNRIGWDAATGATGYDIARDDNRSGTFNVLASNVSGLTYDDNTATLSVASSPGSGPLFWATNIYRYKVRARNAAGVGAWSTSHFGLYYANGVLGLGDGDFSGGFTANYNSTSGSPQGGHSQCMQLTATGDFPDWNAYVGNWVPEWNCPIGAWDYLQFDIRPAFSGAQFQMSILRRTNITQNNGDTSIVDVHGSQIVTDLTPYLGTLAANTWKTNVRVPFSALFTDFTGGTGVLQTNHYKWNFQIPNTFASQVVFLDNVKFVPA